MSGVVLLAGGTGFIGSRLGQVLVENGYKVRLLCRNPDSYKGLLSFPCELFGWQAPDYDIPEEAISGADIVINLSGAGIADAAWTKARREVLKSSRVDTAKAVCRAIAAQQNKPRVYIQASAVGFYGDRADEDLDEESKAGSGFLSELTQEWEAAVSLPDSCPTRVVRLRIGLVLQRGGGLLEKLSEIYASGLGANLGSGNQWVSWIHLEDAVALVLHSIENESISGPLNLSAPEPLRFRDFHRGIAEFMNAPKWPSVPQAIIKTALPRRSELFLSSTKVLPKKALASGFSFKFESASDCIAELGSTNQRPGVEWLCREQWVPKRIDEIWEFFSQATNLEKITPEWLKFRVLKTEPQAMQSGTTIDYALQIHGIPFRWRSRIDDWEVGKEFVDTQLKGPYRFWHHRHRFITLGEGTLIQDYVQFKIPLGYLGSLALGAFVRKDLRTIFNYRMKIIRDLMN